MKGWSEKGEVYRDPVGASLDGYTADIRQAGDDVFRTRKAQRKVAEVLRRCHHNGVRKSIISKCDRNFLRYRGQP